MAGMKIKQGLCGNASMENTALWKKLLFRADVDYLNQIRKLDASKVFSNGRVYLRPVTCDDDLRYCFLDLRLNPGQEDLVNPPYISLSRAYLSPHDYYPFIIVLHDGTKVGFLTLNTWLPKKEDFSFSILIDGRYQGRGHGSAAISLALEIFHAIDPSKKVKIAVEESNSNAQRFYHSLGFLRTEERDGDDIVFAYISKE